MACADVAEPVPIPPLNQRSSWFGWLPSWQPTSEALLEEAESMVLRELTSEYKDIYVPIGPNAVIRTIVMEPEDTSEPDNFPLVMIHGFGCGIPQFYKNLDHLHSKRRLYAIDLPGFARSTRIPFTPDAEAAENEFVDHIEKWRQEIGLEKFILLGHSLGGFISCAYAMKHPSRVRHLILDDPWGFAVRTEDPNSERRIPLWIIVTASVLSKFNPFTAVRLAGPFGPRIMSRFRADLGRKFGQDFMNYVYHSNAQNPTGETAYFHMQILFGWSKRPMLSRLNVELDANVPMTLIYGARSWMDNSSGEKVRGHRPNSYVAVHYIKRAGHHVHADQPEEFNTTVNRVCSTVDAGMDVRVDQSIPESPESDSHDDSP